MTRSVSGGPREQVSNERYQEKAALRQASYARKREMLHVVITGRNAKEELMDMADLVTEMRLIKHPYKAGIKAQRGVEF